MSCKHKIKMATELRVAENHKLIRNESDRLDRESCLVRFVHCPRKRTTRVDLSNYVSEHHHWFTAGHIKLSREITA